MKYSLRPATAEDFEFIFQLNKTNMRKYVEVLRGWNDEAERAEKHRYFRPGHDQIIVIDGKDAGILVVDRSPTNLHLTHIELLPDYQGHGTGTVIIGDLLEEARQAQVAATLMVLTLNPARRLYERLGFRVVGEVDTGPTGVKYSMTTAAQGQAAA